MAKRNVAWASSEEFIDVANKLQEYISSNAQDRQNSTAMHLISSLEMWRLRVPEDKLSRSVRCTLELLCSLVGLDPGLYLAVERFVTLMTSESQERTDFTYSLPMHSLAQKVGLPSDLVDLRHDLAHGRLPAYNRVHEARETALQFLWDRFWLPNVLAYSAILKEDVIKWDNLQNALHHYSIECNSKKAKSDVLKQLDRLFNSWSKWRHVGFILWQPGFITSSGFTKDLPKWLQLFQMLKRYPGALVSVIESCFLSFPPDSSQAERGYVSALIEWSRQWLLALKPKEKSKKHKNDLKELISGKNGISSCDLSWSEIVAHLMNCDKTYKEIFSLILTVCEPPVPEYAQHRLNHNFSLPLLEENFEPQIKRAKITPKSAWGNLPGLDHEAYGWGVLHPMFPLAICPDDTTSSSLI